MALFRCGELSGGGTTLNLVHTGTPSEGYTVTGLEVGKRYICYVQQLYTSGTGGASLQSGATLNETIAYAKHFNFSSSYFCDSVYDITATSTTVVFQKDYTTNGTARVMIYEIV